MTDAIQEPSRIDTNINPTETPQKRQLGACGLCREKKRRCDREEPCKQCSSRKQSHMCAYTITNRKPSRTWRVNNVVAATNVFAGPSDILQDPVQAELAALRRTIAELQDRVWRNEVQLAAAGSGNSRGSEEVVALVMQKYTDLERGNQKLAAQVAELQTRMLRTPTHVGVYNASAIPQIRPANNNNSTGIPPPLTQPPQPYINILPTPEAGKSSHQGDGERRRRLTRVSVACVPCKVKKIKCDGVRSGCAACAIHRMECVFDLTRDKRRKRESSTMTGRIDGNILIND